MLRDGRLTSHAHQQRDTHTATDILALALFLILPHAITNGACGFHCDELATKPTLQKA